MRGFKNFKGSDARCPSIHFLLCFAHLVRDHLVKKLLFVVDSPIRLHGVVFVLGIVSAKFLPIFVSYFMIIFNNFYRNIVTPGLQTYELLNAFPNIFIIVIIFFPSVMRFSISLSTVFLQDCVAFTLKHVTALLVGYLMSIPQIL